MQWQWGYDSAVLHLRGQNSQNSVYGHATSLSNDLARKRQNETEASA